MRKRARIRVIVAIAGLVNGSSADVIWPTDGDWKALMQGTDLYYDAAGDKSPGAIDLIGTTDTFSAGYWALAENGYVVGGISEDALMFRLRLGDEGSGSKFSWQISLDTDGIASDVEWILQLVQSGPPSGQGVELIRTATGGPTLGDVDTGSNTSAWLEDANLVSRWSAIPASSDYHLDIAIPWQTFTSATDVTETEQLRAVLSTSPSHGSIGGDAPLGALLTDQISDVLSDTIPEPAVASLLLGAGFGFLVFRRIFSRHSDNNESPEYP